MSQNKQESDHKERLVNEPEDSPDNQSHHGSQSNATQNKTDLAAAKIQAGFRGYKTRKELGHLSHFRHHPHSYSTASESGSQSHGASSSEHTPTHHAHSNINPDNAATVIQASFRGYKTRKALRDDNINKHTDQCLRGSTCACPKTESQKAHTHDDGCHHNDDESRAATVIQAGFRGYQTRKHLDEIHHHAHLHPHGHSTHPDKENEEEAATRIQATYRGFAVRKKVKNLPRSKSECASSHSPHHESDPEKAATKIQATFRGYLTRHHLHEAHPQ